MNRKTIVIITSILLLATTIFGVYHFLQKPKDTGFIILSSKVESDRVTYIQKCDFPESLDELSSLSFTTINASESDMRYIANNFADMSIIKEIVPLENGETHLEGASSLMRLKGKNNFLSISLTKDSLHNIWNETQTILKADQIKDELLSYLPETQCEVYLMGVFLGSETIENNASVIHTVNVKYGFTYEGIPVTGNGGILSIGLCNGRLIEIEAHIPYLEAKSKVAIITPEKALNRFLEQKKVSEYLLNAYGTDTDIEITIDSFQLVYYYNFLESWTGDMAIYYKISGKEKVLSSSGELLYSRNYVEMITATT
ncbi:hypothetical protein GF319_06460 [Candidatus Bathyarchaeota archaeon]|nr:hypothetical protein [Candidatus Bathyarchaeota archaeon]